MSIDLSQFLTTFYEESFEGLDVMESELLNLDIGAADPEIINTIFRAAHSIKGGGGTFGLSSVSSYTHHMETLLDEVRDGRRQVTQEAVDILLQAVDVLRDMLNALRDNTELDAQSIADSQHELEQLLGGASSEVSTTEDTQQRSTPSLYAGWTIKFRPHADLFKTGNDPVRMFRELGKLGALTVDMDMSALPAFTEMDPQQSYMSWALVLKGDVAQESVQEIFEWVEDECDLELSPIPGEPIPAAPIVDEKQEEPERRIDDRRQAERRRSERRGSGEGEATSIRVAIDKVDDLINMMGELVITQSMLSQLGEAEEFTPNHIEKLRKGLSQLERNTRELQENAIRIRMQPISFAFQRFPRVVHDLSAQFGKKIELQMSGEQTELDKTVMEKIGDPLVHLVRNSLDHGIETPEQRLAAGKPETGIIQLNAYHEGGNINIEVKDDGAGLNTEKILAKARSSGVIREDDQLDEAQIHDLIFQAGFSTAEVVSNVSGRGVGMDVVRKNIRALGGSVQVESEPGKGSLFRIRLPLTLAILDGQSVRVGETTYIIPLISIVESIQADPQFVIDIAGRAQAYKLRNDYLPIVRLHQIFSVKADSQSLQEGLLVMVEGEGRKIFLFVDDLLGQQQVVIKSMETNFKKVEGISGATILGDGTVALILDVGGLIFLSKEQEGGSPERVDEESSKPEDGPDQDDRSIQAA